MICCFIFVLFVDLFCFALAALMEVDPSSTSPVPPNSQSPPNNSKPQQSGNNSSESGRANQSAGQVRANREDEDKKKKIAVAAVADPAKNAQSLKGYFFCF